MPIIHLLFASGASPSKVNKHGKTPLDLGYDDVRVVVFFEMLAKADDAQKYIDAQAERRGALRRAGAATLLEARVHGQHSRSKHACKAFVLVEQARMHAAREQAATGLQAFVRGRAARRNMGHQGKLDRSDNAARQMADWHVMGSSKPMIIPKFGYQRPPKPESVEDAEARHPWAATKLQAVQRGKRARRTYQAKFGAEVAARKQLLASQQ